MRHLTLAGQYAGTPICGCDRLAAAKNGDTFMHIPSWKQFQSLRRDMCEKCVDEYLEAMAMDDDFELAD